jgi:hypothetical protein
VRACAATLLVRLPVAEFPKFKSGYLLKVITDYSVSHKRNLSMFQVWLPAAFERKLAGNRRFWFPDRVIKMTCLSLRSF